MLAPFFVKWIVVLHIWTGPQYELAIIYTMPE